MRSIQFYLTIRMVISIQNTENHYTLSENTLKINHVIFSCFFEQRKKYGYFVDFVKSFYLTWVLK